MVDPTTGQAVASRDELRAFATTALERFTSYHDHKETMAYAGTAVYVAAAAHVLTSTWPPPAWTWQPKILALLAFSAFWLAMLYYLRFQLQRRRWAALRAAGCDRLLASWLPGAPAHDEFAPTERAQPRLSAVEKLADWFWPLNGSVPAVDTTISVYPREITQAWLAASKRGTEAIRHERLIHVVGWVLYGAVVIRTLAA